MDNIYTRIENTMRLLETLIDENFEKLTDGRWVFYPWGSMFAGYILPNEEDREKARIFLKNNYILLCGTLIIVTGLTSIIAMKLFWLIAIISILIMSFVYSQKVKHFTEHMEKLSKVIK